MPILRHDVTLHYRDFAGPGTPLLLLHAFPVDGESFAPQAAHLSGRHRLVIPDQRGFGHSSTGDDPSQMSDLAADGLRILDALDIDSAVIAGVSMGGYAAMALLRAAPARVKGLVLIGTHPFADDDAQKLRREEVARDIEARGVATLVESMPGKLLSPSAPPSVVQGLLRAIRRSSPRGAANASRGMALRPDSRDVLARYAGPCLVIWGTQDVLVPLERARAPVELIPGAQWVAVEGAGHLVNLEAPEVVNAALDRFLSEKIAAS